MSSELNPTTRPDDPALAALRATALATKKQADDAQAALLAVDPTSGPPAASAAPARTTAPGINLADLEALMSRAIAKSTEELRDGITAVTRENTSIKASQNRLESQRRRVNDVGKSEGKTMSLGKQLDFTEDLLASLEGIKDLALGIVLDKPGLACSPASPASPSQAVCKIADCKDGALMHTLLEELITSSKAKLKELTIVWNAPSYRVAFEAIRGCDNTDGAVGEDAMKEISEAVTRVDKLSKRKDQPGWGDSANKAQKAGGWGSSYPAQEQQPAQSGSWGQGNVNAQTQSNGWGQGYGKGQGKGGKGKSKAPYPPAGAPPPAYFSGNAAPRGRPSSNQCAYCFKEGHYKDTCPDLAAQNAKWQGGGW